MYKRQGETQSDHCLDAQIPRGRWIFQLRWNGSWPGADTDLDLYLIKGTEASGAEVESSKGLQDGGESSVPIEGLIADIGAANPPGTYCLAVVHSSGPAPEWVQMHDFSEVDCFGRVENNTCYPNRGHRSIGNPAETANPGALAVGAIGYHQFSDGDIIAFVEDFSSRGPVNDGRVKPDLSGIDRLQPDGSYSGDYTYSGTSLSLIHI